MRLDKKMICSCLLENGYNALAQLTNILSPAATGHPPSARWSLNWRCPYFYGSLPAKAFDDQVVVGVGNGND